MSATGPPPGVVTGGGGGPPPGVVTGGSGGPPSSVVVDGSGRTRGGGYVDPNWPSPMGPNDAPVIIYGYTPSFALALLGVILFFLFSIVHIFQLFKHKSWYFTTFAVGLTFEIVGYIARTLSAKKNPYNLIYFIIQYFFVVTAPVFMSAAIYTILSSLINRLGREKSVLSPRIILWFFITSDVIATVTQIAGAALIGVRQSRREDPTSANHILLGGLAYQVFSIGLFIILTSIFLWRTRKQLKDAGLTTFIAAFSFATLMVYLRTVFRLAETAEGLGGDLSTKEVYFGTLEFMPIVLAVALFTIWHPGRCVGSRIATDDGKNDSSA